MSLHFDRKLALAGVIITTVIFLGHYGLPEKRLTLYPGRIHIPELISFADVDSGPSTYWSTDEKKEWICDYRANHSFGCGWNMKWESENINSIDMTDYDYVDILLDYDGPATRIRLFLRNFNPGYSQASDPASTKYMSTTIPVADLKQSVRVGLTELKVASWWLQENNIHRQWTLPELDRITVIGVDFVEPGKHRTQIKKITLSGQWIKTETLLLIIIGFWMTMFLTDGFVRLYCLYALRQRERRRMRRLEEKQHKLELEKRDLKLMADTDPLTGVYNRVGMQAQIALRFDRDSPVPELGLMLLDIDHFKQLNDSHGHDMGDKVLKAFAAAIAANLRSDDIFARWDGEAFVVLCHYKSESDLVAFAEKLRELAANYAFGSGFEVTITISIGVTVAETDRSFEEALKRAGKALNRAKNNGRNRVEIEL